VKKLIIILLTVFLSSVGTLAQEAGQILGTIVDAENGEIIIGASIGIIGTTTGAASDIDGNYTIPNLAPGTYDLRVSYISYQTQNITGVEVVAGETTKLDIAMRTEVANLDEITVTAEAILDSEAGLLRQRQKSIAFSDAISAEAISRSGSGDAAGALKKVVGASVVGGKYVYIRGLGDRYTSSHLNGTELPSADPNRKAFQLDIFPSSLLENIVTLKTFTPDKPGNFSGGLIDVNTKDFPTERLFQVSTSIGYITNTTFEDVLLSERGDTDWLGHDDGGRSIPEFAVNYLNNPNNENFPRANAGEKDPEIAQTLNLLAKSFSSDFEPDPINAYLNHSYGVTLGNKASLFGKELGYIASLTYGESFDSYDNGVNAGYELIGSPSDATGLTANFDYDDERGSRTVDIGGLINFAYKLSSNHKIKTTFIATQSGSQSGRLLNGFDQDFEGSDLSNRVVEYTERSLRSGQLGGKHSFPKLANSVIEWKTAYTKNTQDEPNRRLAVTQSEERVLAGNDTTIYSFPNGLKFPLRFYRELEEESYNASVDVSIPFVSFNGGKGSFKLGGLINQADRFFREDAFDFEADANQLLRRPDVRGNLDAYVGLSGIIGMDNEEPIFGVLPREISDDRNNYDGKRDIASAYGMIELPIVDKFKIITGARIESAQIELVSQDTSVAIGNLDDSDLLPSVSAIYSINDNMNIRGSVTKTLARPTFRELAPYVTVNFSGGRQEVGNQNLQRTLITNLDLRWEWFPNPGEVIAVSAFGKRLENPIETVIDLQAPDGDRITYKNVEEGTVLGIEFEIKKNLGFISDAFRNFGLSTNLTLVNSEVDIPAEELEDIRQTDPNADDTRPLFGQSDYIINMDLAYENPDIGYTASINMNKFGDRLTAVSFGATPNVYERSYTTLDFLTSKTIGHSIELSFSLKNILNPDIVDSQEFKDQEFINSSFKRGRSFSLGVKYKL
tara:strand:+ start:94276 stop:97152 length:2877 start_codon:yes stop_codon:yes gene_type:complete